MEQEMSIPVNHDDFIHDVAYSFYGTRLATCGSDRCIKVWDWSKQTGLWILNESLTGHESSVVRVSWAHPEFGQVLASCSLDRTVRIWMEQESNMKNSTMRWKTVAALSESPCAVHSVAFAPEYRNLALAAAGSDGKVRFYAPSDEVTLTNWVVSAQIDFVPGGASDSDGPLCLSWCKSRFSATHMIAIAGSKGNKVQVYQLDTSSHHSLLHELDSYESFVLDIDWAPSMGRSYHLIATASVDGHIRIYKFWSDPVMASAALADSLFVREGDDLDSDELDAAPIGTIAANAHSDDDFDDDDEPEADSDIDDDEDSDDANSDSDDSDSSASESGDEGQTDESGHPRASDRKSRRAKDSNESGGAGGSSNSNNGGAGGKAAVPRSELVADLFVDPQVPIRRVRWNSTGTLLASSSDDGVVRMWKMSVNGTWRETAAITAEEERAEV
ncbi:epoxide hydrolase, soluble (sEH) [Coemansia sp. Benny D115]|nr:epoxide hydrolase, soluble (sEH) [Coemansia sp. Benny D115]